ncbi:274_t:CDS:2 [Cetraspora pellucida]|uniref:274_t:CDS:1 n=1 Tax=Cetraspora pellucida TaxID=1433469 RepID=A0A9N9CF88_9GLOM|nr:274_t:CDS:2 [Cetraspora pellucida]
MSLVKWKRMRSSNGFNKNPTTKSKKLTKIDRKTKTMLDLLRQNLFLLTTFVIANAFNAMAAPVPDEMNPGLVVRDM